VGFDVARNEKLLLVLHVITKEDKGPKLALRGFRSSSFANVKDTKVNILHMIFNLKGVLVGRAYFRINHLLPLSYSLAWNHTLLNKKVVPRPCLKGLFFKCLE
jgi:hypothetical protein